SKGEEGHGPVDRGRNDAFGERGSDRLYRGEARKNIADMPLLEIRDRKPQQMVKQPCTDLKMQNALKDQQDQRTYCRRDDFDRREQPEADRQHDEEIDVSPRNHLIHSYLQIEGAGNHEGFEDQREDQNLDDGMRAAAQLGPERCKSQARTIVFRREAFGRRGLERDAGQMLGGFGDGQESLAASRVMNHNS